MAEWWNSLSTLYKVFFCMAVPATAIMLLQTILLFIGIGGHSDSDADADGDVDGDIDADVDGDIDADGADFDVSDGADIDADGADFDISDGADIDADGADFDVSDGADIDADGADFDVSDGADGGFDVSGVSGDPADEIGAHGPTEGGKDAGLRLFSIRTIIAFFAVGGWTGTALIAGGASESEAIIGAFAAGAAALVGIALLFKYSLKLQDNGTVLIRNSLGKQAEVYLRIPENRSGKGKVFVLVQERFTEYDAVTVENEAIRTGEKVRIIGIADGETVVVKREAPKDE